MFAKSIWSGKRKGGPHGFPVCGSLNAHVQSPIWSAGMRFCFELPQGLYYMSRNSKRSGETVLMRRLAWALAGRLCDNNYFLMSWLIWYLKGIDTILGGGGGGGRGGWPRATLSSCFTSLLKGIYSKRNKFSLRETIFNRDLGYRKAKRRSQKLSPLRNGGKSTKRNPFG